MSRTVKVGGASGFWGDSNEGARQLVTAGVDYLMLDYLAELTLSIMARTRSRDSGLGYATDFVREAMPAILREVAAGKVRVISNAGGMNPSACAQALRELALSEGVELQIGVVEGDDILPLQEELRKRKSTDMFEGFPVPDELTSLNAYLGAFPIARALDMGAQVVITGRCVDSALALAPLIHEFGWKEDDYDLLAAGSILGHIIECGTQVTGGLFTDWRDVLGRDNIGFPIAECRPDGTFDLIKPADTGGLITPLSVAEQLFYEVHDPENYYLPDVVCDISMTRLEQVSENRVRFSGIRGREPGDSYKASATFADGFRTAATLTIVGFDAEEKARVMGGAILERTRRLFRECNLGDYSETCVEVLGSGVSALGGNAVGGAAFEVVLRISVRHEDDAALKIFAREIAPFGTSGVPGTTGFGGRPKPQQVFRLFSVLVPKDEVEITVSVGEEVTVMKARPGNGDFRLPYEAPDNKSAPEMPSSKSYLPLIDLAVARSGDKGDMSNIAVIAREPEFFDLLVEELTPERVRHHFSHLVNGEVTRYLAPGCHALNFVLDKALAGGGSASLRNDALGKTFAQILLTLELPVPADVHSLVPSGRIAGTVS